MRWMLLVPCLLLGCGKGTVTVNEAEADADTDADTDSDTDADTDTDTDADTDIHPSPFEGKTYALDLGTGTFVQPPGIGAILQAQLDEQILLGLLSANNVEAQFIGALGDGSEPPLQDLCTASIDFPPADFTMDPLFQVGPDDTTIRVSEIDVEVKDMFVAGSFNADGSVIEDARLEGSIDTRPLVPLLDPNGGPGAICALVGFFQIQCQPCTGGGNFCLSLVVEDLDAAEVPGLTLVERTEDDVDVDPACED